MNTWNFNANVLFFLSTARCIIKCLVFLMVINGIPLNHIARQCQWTPNGIPHFFRPICTFLSTPDASAGEVGQCMGDLDGNGKMGYGDIVILSRISAVIIVSPATIVRAIFGVTAMLTAATWQSWQWSSIIPPAVVIPLFLQAVSAAHTNTSFHLTPP